MDRIPEAYLPDAVTLEVHTGFDDYGTPSFAAPVTYRARVIHRHRSRMDATGRLVIERGQVIIDGDPPPTLQTEDRLTLPNGETPPLIEVEMARTPEGEAHHSRAIFG